MLLVAAAFLDAAALLATTVRPGAAEAGGGDVSGMERVVELLDGGVDVAGACAVLLGVGVELTAVVGLLVVGVGDDVLGAVVVDGVLLVPVVGVVVVGVVPVVNDGSDVVTVVIGVLIVTVGRSPPSACAPTPYAATNPATAMTTSAARPAAFTARVSTALALPPNVRRDERDC